MKKQRWLLVLGATLFVFCFFSTTPSAEVTIRVANQASQWADAFKKFVPKFTEETGIKIEFEDISFGVMYEKLKTTFIGGTSKSEDGSKI
jgi:ABC-type glycerol-3-phosphate transport system substrate-binding protein